MKITLPQKLTHFLGSRRFKKVAMALGVVFLILAFVISTDPKPFLKFGYLGVFIFNLFGPGTFLIPILSSHMNIFALAAVTSLGMATNDSVSFLIGRGGEEFIGKSTKIKKIQSSLQRFGSLGLFFWSLIPFPYDLIGFIAGYLDFPYLKFFIPTFLGKFTRMLLIALGFKFLIGHVT